MLAQQPEQRFTEAEYLALEAASHTKHAFVNGHIIAMAGATPAHNLLAVNMTTALRTLTRGKGCVVFNSDQRIHIPATGLYTYPDVALACGERRFENDSPPSLVNPTVLVEVTSKTTEGDDRGYKFLHYQSIPSLREYIVVSHRERRIDHHRRLDTGQWLLTSALGEDAVIESAAAGGSVGVREIYEDVELEAETP